MEEDERLISVYTGNEASAILLKNRLDMMGISAIVRKASNAGTWGVVADNIELFIVSDDKERAQPIINEFIKSRR
jgi:Asp/Glu/hydantoin racemase